MQIWFIRSRQGWDSVSPASSQVLTMRTTLWLTRILASNAGGHTLKWRFHRGAGGDVRLECGSKRIAGFEWEVGRNTRRLAHWYRVLIKHFSEPLGCKAMSKVKQDLHFWGPHFLGGGEWEVQGLGGRMSDGLCPVWAVPWVSWLGRLSVIS